ncbi:MAG: polysaccharide biosynthesis protein [Clostridia bacterium]|nr:polysaccharide biosynthesis protein [Clostridia bacterium]
MKKISVRKYVLFFLDLIITAFSLAVCTIAEAKSFATGGNFLAHLAMLLALAAVLRFALFRYTSVWRYAGARDYARFIVVDILVFGLYMLADRFIAADNAIHVEHFKYSGYIVPIAAFALTELLVLASRFFYQLVIGRGSNAPVNGKENVLVFGAGEAGIILEMELRRPKSPYKIVAFVDSDSEKIGKRINGIKIYAEKDADEKLLEALGAKTVIIAIPSLSLQRRGEIVRYYTNLGCKVRIFEYQMNRRSDDALAMRDVRIEDLLGRDVVRLDLSKFSSTVRGKCVLVTGAGGSIGSELCRQIASAGPERLVLFDVYENTTYAIQQELRRKYGGGLKLNAVIGTMCDEKTVDKLFSDFKPDIVFHAAAHKHVPLMEDACREAVLNNVFGTYNVANAAEKHGAEKMVLISTDKAVNPTNVMGATKRLCEMIILSKFESQTEYAAVRFGNVLGSNGSVIPLFKEQIASGGPVTLTDKRIVRYFMTIPDAVSLVLEAETIAADSEIFVLDMGEPVKILDLAESLVTLSGFKPYKDIDIIEVGLRPGEKLYEELLIKTEGLVKTDNQKIFIDRDAHVTPEELEEKLRVLKEACDTCDNELIRKAVASVVPTYTPTDNAESRKNASHLSLSRMKK